MTTLAQATSTNVETTLNAWLQAALEDFDLPHWLPDLPGFVETVPQKPAVMPCFSFIHLPIDSISLWQGRWAGTSKGMRTRGMLDVSCWVSRSGSKDWLMQLRTMRDLVLSAVVAQPSVVIIDYAALPRSTVAPVIDSLAVVGVEVEGNDGTWSDVPLATEYKINIGDVTLTPTAADTNPDVERVRVLIDYHYVFRVSS